MTEPALERRRKKAGKGAVLGVVYAACFVFAVVVSAVVIFNGNETLMRVGFVLALWAALGWAFIADNSRRKAELVSAKASDYKLIYDLQLEREIAARHHYELSLENELRRQLTAEADATTHNALSELQQQVAVLRGQLQELLDQDLEYDQPALKARATRLDELLVARQSLGTHESQPRKRAAEAVAPSHESQWGTAGGTVAPANPANGGEQGAPRLWLPSQPDQGRREQAQQHGGAEQGRFEAPRPEPLSQASEPEPLAHVAEPEQVASEPVAESAAEQWPPAEQPVVWQQQQPQEASWESPQTVAQEQPAVWQQPEPVAQEPERTFDYPSWYAQPAVEEAAKAEPSGEYPGWYNQPVASEPVAHAADPVAQAPEPVEPQPLLSGPEPVEPAEPEPLAHVAEPVAQAPEPVEPQPLLSEPEPVAETPEPVEPQLVGQASEPVEPESRQETTHGKPEKSKHAGKGSNRAKPNESRGGRRAKPADGGEAASAEEGQDAAAAAADLAGAHASGHSVGELLSRLTPDEAAGYHGRRRRSQMLDDEAR